MTQSAVILTTLIVYKVTLIGIGFWASRRMHDEADFFLGGRGLGPWVAGLSYAASTSSAWVILGFSGFVYANGVSALWMVPGIWAGYVAVWLWFGPHLRRETRARGWITPTDFMTANVDPRGRATIGVLAAALVIFCFVFYIAAQFDAAAKAFASQFEMGFASSVLLGAVIILVYCLLGGFWAVSVTDTLQGAVMVGAALLVPGIAVWHAGGPVHVFDTLAQTPANPLLDPTGGLAGMLFLGFALGIAAIGLGTLGQPHLLARLMAVRGERERRQGFAIAMTWAVLVYIGMAMLALSARSLAMAPASGEELFYRAAAELLPPVLAGVVIAAILSAVMSTVDSLLLAASAAVAHDLGLVRRFPGRDLTISRVVMTVIAGASVTLALTLPDTIFNRVLFAWSALGAAFGPLIAARVSGREPGTQRRIASIVAGFGVTVLFYAYGTVADPSSLAEPGRTLAMLANLPGDPFERLVPWLLPVIILFSVNRTTVETQA